MTEPKDDHVTDCAKISDEIRSAYLQRDRHYCGLLVQSAKELLGHGSFKRWFRDCDFPFSLRSANLWMNAGRRDSDAYAKVIAFFNVCAIQSGHMASIHLANADDAAAEMEKALLDAKNAVREMKEAEATIAEERKKIRGWLLQAKELFAAENLSDKFGEWLDAEFGMTVEQAESYIAA